MDTFIRTAKLGELVIDRVLFESYYPILFTLRDSRNNVFLCVCHHKDGTSTKWLLTKSSPSEIIALLTNKVTLRQAFLLHPDVRYSVTKESDEIFIEENVYADWNEDSKSLPEDTMIDADEEEYQDDIAYYMSFTNDSIDVWFNILPNVGKLDVKAYILNKFASRPMAKV